MFLVAIAFLGGHGAAHGLTELPAVLPWVPLTVFAGAAAAWARRYGLAALLIGFAWASSHAILRLSDQLDQSQVDAEVVGRIASLPDVSRDSQGESVRFVFQIESADRELPKSVELSWYDAPAAVSPGDLWRLRIRLRAPRGFANPGGSDYEAQLLRAGIGATGYVRDAQDSMRLAGPEWRFLILRARAAISRRIADVVPPTMLGIIQGLSVGDTQQITPLQWRVFANTGTTHLMAISGLHVAMVAALAAWMAGAIARRMSLQSRGIAAQDVQSIGGLAAAVAYSALAGFSVPTQRTLVMLGVYFATRLLRRNVNATQGLGIALIGVLLVDPFAPLAPGFWLSFGAVTAIFLAMGGRLQPMHWLKEYLAMQAAVTVGLLPFLIGAFGSVSLLSPLINLAAIPFYTFVIVPLVLLGSLLALIFVPLGAPLLLSANALLEWSWPAMEWAAGLPLAMWHLPQLPIWLSLSMLCGCFACIGPGVWMTRLAAAMLCLPALFWLPQRAAIGDFDLTVLDVGQGLATVVSTRSHVLVYDVGPSFRSGRDTGELVVLPFLRSRGLRRVDALMVSHGDNDHVGGMASVMLGTDVTTLIAGPTVRAPSDAQRCQRGQRWEWDGVHFEILHPLAPDGGFQARNDNDSSCVLRITGRGGSALLFGDIERRSEERLVSDGAIERTDVVVVPHHGSRTSSTVGLVRATAPRYAIVSAGHGNRWGFPKEDVLARWEETGARTLNTATSGAIEFSFTADRDIVVREYRRDFRRYWRR